MIRFKQWFRSPLTLALVAGSTAVGACGISRQQEVQMGQEYAAEINRQLPMVNDASVNQYINNLGRSIAQRGNRQYNYNFYVVNAAQINAFAVPGGHVYVNRGLVERTRNMAELAGVLAHEIAHVEHRHGVEQMEKMQAANIGLTLGYVLLGRAPSGIEEAAIGIGGNLYFARHSRGAENEADAMAVPLLANSGINPNGLTSFFNVLLSDQQRSPSSVAQWFSTHPLTQDRIENTQSYINRLPASGRGGRTDDAGYA
ncbi:MAG: M48 family metallopeptidase, partial [Longimicrobiales bacterium]